VHNYKLFKNQNGKKFCGKNEYPDNIPKISDCWRTSNSITWTQFPTIFDQLQMCAIKSFCCKKLPFLSVFDLKYVQ
jgi:hypothetical protein